MFKIILPLVVHEIFLFVFSPIIFYTELQQHGFLVGFVPVRHGGVRLSSASFRVLLHMSSGIKTKTH